MFTLKIVTWNVRGFRTLSKRTKVINYLSKLKADICFLQETHITQHESQQLQLGQYNKIYSATYNSKQRGVSILVNNNLLFTQQSITNDPDGRFLIMNVSINNTPFTLVNVYGPNNDDPLFFHTLFATLQDKANILLAGDFNTVINPSLDRSNPTVNTRHTHSSDTIKQYMQSYGLSDSWRMNNPTKLEYTYTSPHHHSSSRLDFFLISNSLTQYITENKIYPIIISDHAPVSITISNQNTTNKAPSRWRLNTSLLEDTEFNTLIRREWAFFLETNDSPEISPSLLWETGKAVIRGKIISYSSHKKRKKQELESTLEHKIKLLTHQYSTNPDEQTLNDLNHAKAQLDNILHQKTDFIIQQLKYEQFQYSNKSSKLLANLLQHKKEKAIIPTIQNKTGLTTHNSHEINAIFQQYYSDLYSSNCTPSIPAIENFLSKLNLPTLPSDKAQMLEAPLTINEIYKSLIKMPNNKSPGPDGLPAEFYKTFWDILSPLLLRVITEIKTTSKIPPHMNTANITLIPKPNKDLTHPANYRPLSLINTDLKIITKTLATRLETVIPVIIHQDQTGFIKDRYASDNLRKLFNLINITQLERSKSIILSLDAEKAFDKVNWQFLFHTLRKFGFGESFVHWIETLYTSPRATVTTNGITSPSFTLHQGTRQGCPLSPLLFALSIEPLASAIRNNNNIKGIQNRNEEYKISLYADDLLLHLQNPETSLKETFSVINNFSTLSNYTINWSKSTLLPLTQDSWDSAAQKSFPSLHLGNIKYLGITISSRLSELFNLNYPQLLKKIENNLKGWNNLPLTLTGRIAAVKMKILPQITYLFSMIPTTPTDNWFKSLNTTVTQFYWKNKKPRISLSTLQNSKQCGGLEAPVFINYFLATQLQYLFIWINKRYHNKAWIQLEQSQCQNTPIADLPFLPQSIKKLNYFKSITISTTLTAWWKTRKTTDSSQAPCKFTPIWHNPDFQLHNSPIYFPLWHKKGITHLSHLFQNNTFIPFNALIQKFGVGREEFLHYQQIKHIFKSKNISAGILQPSPIVNKILNITSLKKITSKLYKIIITSKHQITLPLDKWENNLGISPNPDFWMDICKNLHSMTTNVNLQLIQYKTLHRTHLTQSRLHQMKFSDTDICSQCTLGCTDNYLHATWDCTPVHSFWISVTDKLSIILDCRVPLHPSLCLLGDITQIDLPNKFHNPLLISLTVAKKVIFQNWKNKKACNIKHWITLITDLITTEKNIANKQKHMSAFSEIWTLFLNYFNI